jgi:hypothetical protein
MPVGSVDLGDDVTVSLSDQDRRALESIAADRGMTPAEWLASLARALQTPPAWRTCNKPIR